ncbi:hypothetical protein BDV32DRAFT_117318 [Aspergillus pseudonomiae]|uniref:Uncharacterized protein n=1 Tax=Aspergillus pseudonomiae TaxID=1506151 RepID=A0A5N6IFR2_9EURO|nr:uncharacterized protein BDV37DRAFT_72272 [Aspergillus pseudonomiae]KAB8264630.1 hypothetical protein BDV32DRAFT_117318 [Aspergillus pseudonomiae]KAE8405993.1 hypothetical protein BDV37DRAFT_72272 [Aspergillus pseudonomiae]
MDTTSETSVTVEQLPPVTPNMEPHSTTDTGATTVALDAPISDAPESSTDQLNNAMESPLLMPEQNISSQDTSADEHEPTIRSDISAPPRPPPPEVEHAYWAEMEEDTSVPDEAEMKEIESAADGDYSAYEYSYWEKNFHPDLDDPEYRPVEKARLTWKINGVRGTKDHPNRSKVMRSPAAYIGGYWWSIKFFPRGNNVGSLSIYLECSPTMPPPDKTLPDTEFKVLRGPADVDINGHAPDLDLRFGHTDDPAAWLENYKSHYPPAAKEEKTISNTWRVSAQIGVILYNPDEPRTGWMQSSCHQFNPHNLDWGWTSFHGPWDQIHRRQRGQRQALLRNDTLAFDAYIRIIDDPTRSLWWHPSDSEPTWDSLGLTGYRPLGDSVINHSAEVAGLATWLHIAPFCKIIQNANIVEHHANCDVKPKPLCDALQRFLWQLRSRKNSLQYVDTDIITSTLRNLHEYSGDVCDFWERLRRTLELELAGTSAVKDLAALFDSPTPDLLLQEAQGSDVVNTIPKDFNSRICVPADQVKTIHEALSNYLGSKPGRWALPPILHVEISRQKLDKAARQWRLIYNRVDLDEELDLSPWLLHGQCGKYVLYGYIVHRGRRTSGKFFSILRPGGPGTKWLAFDDGSDNRVECLTRKTALGHHLGLDASQKVDHKTGHDVAIAAMYIRSDLVSQYLPGPQGPWAASPAMKEYYERGIYPYAESPDRKTTEDIQVEVYSAPQYDKLDSLFDTYDLMSQAKAANKVMYLTVPRSTNLIELRKKIALWASAGAQDQTGPEHIRLWQIGHTRDRFGPTLAFSRVSDLRTTLNLPMKTARFWIQVVSNVDAKYFAMADPREVEVPQTKPEEAIFEREDSDSSDDQHSIAEVEAAQAGPSGTASRVDDTVQVVTTDASSEHSINVTENLGDGVAASLEMTHPEDDIPNGAENDTVIAAIIAEDIQQMETEQSTDTPQTNDVTNEPQSVEVSTESSPTDDTSAHPMEPEPALPVDHVYYFIQIFDVEAQALRTVGSFFSQKEETIKAAVRKHLQWPVSKDFQVWQRVDGTTVTTMSSAETFNVFVPDGTCFIVGDKMNKDKRLKLNQQGLLANPDQLVRYLWAKSRNHPIKAFTGFKTIEASFTNEFYSGDLNKGYYHGKGKHVSDSAATYDGDFVLGKRHGKGYMEYPIGDTYDGDWFENQCHGQGTFVEKKTGNKYVGGYKDGKRHGKGISYWEVADEEMDLCQICYCEEQDALFYDCGHVCACVTCARQVEICPICRKNIISVVKIYRT